MKLRIRCREISHVLKLGVYEIGRAGFTVFLANDDEGVESLASGSAAVSLFKRFKGHLTVEVQEDAARLYDNDSTHGSEFNGRRFRCFVLKQFNRTYDILIGDVRLQLKLLMD